MRKVYFDNAATTYPKPERVAEAVYDYIKNNGMNIGRGIYDKAFEAAEAVYETRELLCKFFDWDKPENVVFTSNVTEALNIVIKGFLKPGDHVLVSSLEHNAVMRPLNQLTKIGVFFDRLPCNSDGKTIFDKNMIKENTKAVIINHASNVFGTVSDIEETGKICSENGLKFIVDSAQSAGTIPISMKKCHIDALCFTGHKGLYGPQGIGGFIITDDMAEKTEPLISGGTGSQSDMETVPDFMPDRFEAGTLNIPGIYGLREGLKFINETGIKTIADKELLLTKLFIESIEQIPNYKIIGSKTVKNRTATVSVTANTDMANAAFILEKQFGIMTRVGMHCAPNAHKVMGTFPSGTIRFSFGFFNTEEEIMYAVEALKSDIMLSEIQNRNCYRQNT